MNRAARKMMRARKVFTRCSCQGHGQGCEVTDEARGPFSRTEEKIEWRKEAAAQLEEDREGNTND